MKEDRASLAAAIAELGSRGVRKFKIGKALVALSQERPAVLYPFFDEFAGLLTAENNLVKWTAYQIVSRLAAVDKDHRIDAVIDAYLAPIPGPAMITAAHAIAGGARIAASHNHLAERIVRAILQVETARYKTDECRNVAIGHAILALAEMEGDAGRSDAVLAFVRRQTANTRPATRKKAEAFLRKAGRGPPRNRRLRSPPAARRVSRA